LDPSKSNHQQETKCISIEKEQISSDTSLNNQGLNSTSNVEKEEQISSKQQKSKNDLVQEKYKFDQKIRTPSSNIEQKEHISTYQQKSKNDQQEKYKFDEKQEAISNPTDNLNYYKTRIDLNPNPSFSHQMSFTQSQLESHQEKVSKSSNMAYGDSNIINPFAYPNNDWSSDNYLTSTAKPAQFESRISSSLNPIYDWKNNQRLTTPVYILDEDRTSQSRAKVKTLSYPSRGEYQQSPNDQRNTSLSSPVLESKISTDEPLRSSGYNPSSRYVYRTSQPEPRHSTSSNPSKDDYRERSNEKRNSLFSSAKLASRTSRDEPRNRSGSYSSRHEDRTSQPEPRHYTATNPSKDEYHQKLNDSTIASFSNPKLESRIRRDKPRTDSGSNSTRHEYRTSQPEPRHSTSSNPSKDEYRERSNDKRNSLFSSAKLTSRTSRDEHRNRSGSNSSLRVSEKQRHPEPRNYTPSNPSKDYYRERSNDSRIPSISNPVLASRISRDVPRSVSGSNSSSRVSEKPSQPLPSNYALSNPSKDDYQVSQNYLRNSLFYNPLLESRITRDETRKSVFFNPLLEPRISGEEPRSNSFSNSSRDENRHSQNDSRITSFYNPMLKSSISQDEPRISSHLNPMLESRIKNSEDHHRHELLSGSRRDYRSTRGKINNFLF